jgi:hypothetical protein
MYFQNRQSLVANHQSLISFFTTLARALQYLLLTRRTFESNNYLQRILKSMRPTFITTRNEKRFPLIECNYHSAVFSDYRGPCVRPTAPSFRNISRLYFQKEARQDFFGEAILFSILVIAAIVPMVSGAYAVIQLCRAFGAL